jgi:drug/metabolite transporter (DMT)-like permease
MMNTTALIQKRGINPWFANGALLIVAAIWGSTFIAVKESTKTYPVFAFLVMRFGLACLVLLPMAIRYAQRKGRYPSKQAWQLGIVAGMFLTFGYIFQTFALRASDSGRVGFITGLYVVAVPVLALLAFRYPITAHVMVGMVGALIGMMLLGNAPGGWQSGDWLAALCALSFAGQILAVEKVPKDTDWRFMALVQVSIVTLACLIIIPIVHVIHECSLPLCQTLAPFTDPLPGLPSADVLFASLYLGVLATAIAFGVQVWAQRVLPPSNAAIIFAMEAPFAVVFGILLGNEKLTALAFLGCGLIFAGMIITSLGSGQAHHEGEPKSF